jgi:hypothetical protein
MATPNPFHVNAWLTGFALDLSSPADHLTADKFSTNSPGSVVSFSFVLPGEYSSNMQTSARSLYLLSSSSVLFLG